MARLTEKQALFVAEYLVDLNATEAAKRAGYSDKTAYSIGFENLKKPEIQEAIRIAMDERAKRTEITQDRVLQELAAIGFARATDYAQIRGNAVQLTETDELTDEQKKAVAGIKEGKYGILDKAGTYQMAFQAQDITSPAMKVAIKDWYRLYYLQEPTKDEDPCQQIPYTIVRKLTKTTFSEYSATSKDAFAAQVLKALGQISCEGMQQALIGGASYLKPVPKKNGFDFLVVQRNNMLIFSMDAQGNPTDIGTAEVTAHGPFYYTLLERRTVDANGYLTIKCALYRSHSANNLGQQFPLNTLPRYADILDEYTFPEPVGSIGLVPVRVTIENCVDGGKDAVSVYAAATGLIRNINRNEAQLNGEFERGKSKIITSADFLRRDKYGRATIQDDVFVGVDESPDETGITIFSPALREASYLARKQDYLRSVENMISLKRGLLSEVEAVERTAKEITSSEGDYSLTITDFQNMWECAVWEALRICGILGQMYRIPGAHEVAEDQVVINWGNGVLFDEEKTRQRMLGEVQAGLLQPERYLGFVYNRPCETAAQRAKIRKEYMPEVADEPEEDE